MSQKVLKHRINVKLKTSHILGNKCINQLFTNCEKICRAIVFGMHIKYIDIIMSFYESSSTTNFIFSVAYKNVTFNLADFSVCDNFLFILPAHQWTRYILRLRCRYIQFNNNASAIFLCCMYIIIHCLIREGTGNKIYFFPYPSFYW